MNRISLLLSAIVLVIPLLAGTPALPAEAAESPEQQSGHYGISFAVAVVPFVGGASGPTTLISDTDYKDTFDTGYGGRVEFFYDGSHGWRFYLGGVYNQWKGKFFQGGEFSEGAQFDDFNLAGIYLGAKYRFNRESNMRPYLLGNLGVVSLSEVNVTVNGNKRPYWNQTYRDYLDLGVGVEYGLTKRIALFIDVRLEIFGKPDSVDFIAAATSGSTLPVNFGIDYRF